MKNSNDYILKITLKDWLYIFVIASFFGFLISLFFYFVNEDLRKISTIVFSTLSASFIGFFSFILISISNKFILPKLSNSFWYLISFVFSFLAGFLGFLFSFYICSFFDIRIIDFIKPFVIYISVTIGFLTFLIGLILHQFISMKYKNEFIKSEILENKLKALENELNPHFLFNALNSVSELIYIDKKKAEDSVLNLSRFLRNAISKKSLISIKTELAMLKTYVDIENVRFENKINLYIENNSEFENLLIPKFSIQLLVENAIKHGYKGVDLNIYIKVLKNEILVSNDGKVNEIKSFGTGLSNLKRRLELLDIGSLEFENKENMSFKIRIENENYDS